MSFMKRKSKREFLAAPFAESRAVLDNPSRGWYQIHTFLLEREVDFDELTWSLQKEDRLALVFLQIGAFRTAPISAEALERLAKILSFFREHNKEMIIRVAYDNEGNGITAEPDFLAEIEGHMNSIGPCIRQFADSILVAQGLFVGSWGDMHDSKFLAQDKLKRLARTWRLALGEQIPVAVRTPGQWRLLYPPGQEAAQTNTGLFDDGMFASVSHLGTFGVKSREEAAWEEPWSPAVERGFVAALARHVPYGGEALAAADETAKQYDAPAGVVEEMRALGVSYLNRVHDARRIGMWREQICQAADLAAAGQQSELWQGVSVFDYIGAHLGYRYVVRGAVFVEKREPYVSLRIENTGFAPCTRALDLYLVFAEEQTAVGFDDVSHDASVLELCESGQIAGTYTPVPGELHRLGQGLETTLEAPLPKLGPGTYRLYLALRQKESGQTIYFGNEPVARQVYLGRLILRL